MRRNPGVGAGPAALVQTMRRSLVGDPFLNAPHQWGVIDAVHGSYSSTLAAACTAGDLTLSLTASPQVNAYLLLGNNLPMRVTALSGSGPYTATLATAVQVGEASGTAITDMKTADVYFDGTQTLSDTTYLTTGVRWINTYTPAVGDTVVAIRGTGAVKSDRIILGKPAV